MAVFQNNMFVGQRVLLDGHEFRGNTFTNCVLVYGGGPLQLTDNVLNNVRWEFVDAAARTIALLASFFQAGGDSRRFVEFLLSTFGRPIEQPGNAAAGGQAPPAGGGQ